MDLLKGHEEVQRTRGVCWAVQWLSAVFLGAVSVLKGPQGPTDFLFQLKFGLNKSSLLLLKPTVHSTRHWQEV